jgi:CRP-like cAMP-binding protein
MKRTGDIFLWIMWGFFAILLVMKQLNKVSLFKDLSDAEFKELEPYLSTTAYHKKETIFSEGEPPEWFYLVLTGKVKITKLSHEGKEIILEVISPTDIFGGVAVAILVEPYRIERIRTFLHPEADLQGRASSSGSL